MVGYARRRALGLEEAPVDTCVPDRRVSDPGINGAKSMSKAGDPCRPLPVR